MELEKIVNEKPVTITNNGMITIPAALRKTHNLIDGDKVLVVEDEGTLRIIPLKHVEELRKNSYSARNMLNQIRKSRKEEIKKEL